MRILTVSCFSPLWKRYPANVLDLEDGPTVGGGEENFIRCSTGLRALGHEVVAYHCGERGVWRGVEFRTLEDPLYPVIVGEKWDVVAAWSGLRPLEYARPGVRRLFVQQLNDLCNLGDWGTVDCLVSPSFNHAQEARKWGWQGRQAVVHNGCDLELYQPAPYWEDRPLEVGYWSSPDRGLHHLLRAWPLVVKREPKAHLRVFYEIKRYLQLINVLPASFYGERGQDVARLMLGLANDPTVTFHGAVPRKVLAKYQKQCRVQCYPADMFGYCEGFCFPPGTPVSTIRGLKPVELLTLSDEVLGHSGNFRAVTALKTRHYEGKLIRILPACGEAVEFTDDHPILVAADECTPYRWIRADQIRPGMWLRSATPLAGMDPLEVATGEVSIPTKRRDELTRAAANLGGKAPIAVPAAIPLTAELCRLVGYFAGDGNAALRGRAASTVSFSMGGERKESFVPDVQACLREVFGLESIVHDCRPTKQMLRVKVESSAVARVLGRWCYAENHQKQLPPWAMTLSPDLTIEVLKGLWRTDGSVVEMQQPTARFAGFTSSSPYLIDQVRTLLKRVGRAVRIQQRQHETGKVSYSMYFSIADDFLDYPSQRVQATAADTYYARQIEGGMALRVREVTERPYAGTVYALVVATDESHHVGNFLVHNCGSVNQGMAAGCTVLARPEDALPSLYGANAAYGTSIHWLEKDPIDLDYSEWLADQIVKALHNELPNQSDIRARGPKRAYTWNDAALQMEKACRGEWFSMEATNG